MNVFLGSDGTIEHLWGTNDMVTGRSVQSVQILSGEDEPSERRCAHRASRKTRTTWRTGLTACARARPQTLRSEIGYRSAVAAHMANISYRQKQRVTLEEARAFKTQF